MLALIFYLSLVILLGVLFESRGPVLAIAFGVMIGGDVQRRESPTGRLCLAGEHGQNLPDGSARAALAGSGCLPSDLRCRLEHRVHPGGTVALPEDRTVGLTRRFLFILLALEANEGEEL